MANKIIKAENTNKAKKNEKKESVKTASLDAMERLVKVMTNEPSLVKLANEGWEVTALKPAVQWEISKEACKICRNGNASFGDILKSFATNLPSVMRIVTLALLNDKERIAKEYDDVYETLMWESKPEEWGTLLFEILQLHDVGFFFQITQALDIFKETTLQRKMTMEEQKQL